MTLDKRLVRLITAAPAIVALILPQTVSDFRLGQMTGWIAFSLGALGLNLLTGYNGQISLGHGALYGIGAYTCGLLITKAHWAMGWSVLAAASACPRCASPGCTWRSSPWPWPSCSRA